MYLCISALGQAQIIYIQKCIYIYINCCYLFQFRVSIISMDIHAQLEDLLELTNCDIQILHFTNGFLTTTHPDYMQGLVSHKQA